VPSDEIRCTITVKGHLHETWRIWFAGLRIDNLPGGHASLSGNLPDEAALFGMLNRLYELGIGIVSLSCQTGPVEVEDTANIPLEESE